MKMLTTAVSVNTVTAMNTPDVKIMLAKPGVIV